MGANDIASFLITGPEGHVLIDGRYPGTPPLIMASIATLGFDIRDVKVLLNSEPHYDHARGLAELQKASGAELWVNEASADAIASGGDDPDVFLPMRVALIWNGLARYPAPRVDHRFKDGDTIGVGTTLLTAHTTPGHTRGCTSWSFVVRDGLRMLNVVSASRSSTRMATAPTSTAARRNSAGESSTNRDASAGQLLSFSGVSPSATDRVCSANRRVSLSHRINAFPSTRTDSSQLRSPCRRDFEGRQRGIRLEHQALPHAAC